MIKSMQLLERCRIMIQKRTQRKPEVGVVLGSGLGYLTSLMEGAVEVDYHDLPGFPVSTVDGHQGRIVIGELGGKIIAVMQGRFHFYEGYTMEQVVMGVRLLMRLGAGQLVVTNASGGIRPGLQAGDLMLIRDHINLMGDNPLIGPNSSRIGLRFTDMTEAYSKKLRLFAHQAAKQHAVQLQEGVYAAVKGPSYETPAEVSMLSMLGADVVGMSTVPEVIAARHMGVDVLGLSLITNLATGLSDKKLDHQEVQSVARQAEEKLKVFFPELIRQMES